MKNISFFILVTILFFSSCDFSLSASGDSVPYYQISGRDYELLPSRKARTVTYRSQNGEEFSIEYKSWSPTKSCSDYFCNSEGTYNHDIIYSLYSLPDVTMSNGNNRSVGFDISKEKDGSLIYSLGMPISTNTAILEEFTIPQEETIEMTLNGATFKKVLIFETKNYRPTQDYYLFYDSCKINKAYYDLFDGFIGFDDDANDLQFRIVE